MDFTGQTPFLRAALAGDVEVMRLLLEHGADPNISTFSGTTPLMAAAGVNWTVSQTFDEGPAALLEAVKLAQSLGNDVNATNAMGLQAIHGAANRGSDDIIRFLVDKGARLDVADKQGRTPLTGRRACSSPRIRRRRSRRTIALLDTTARRLVARRNESFRTRGIHEGESTVVARSRRARIVCNGASRSPWAALAQRHASTQEARIASRKCSVTGSRIQRDGMTTPTPVTALNIDDLHVMAPTTLAAAMTQLPQFIEQLRARGRARRPAGPALPAPAS